MAEHTTLIACYDGVHVKVGNSWQRLALGAPVPDGADADHVDILVKRGLVAKGEVTGGIDADPDAPPPFQLPDDEPRTSRKPTPAPPAKQG